MFEEYFVPGPFLSVSFCFLAAMRWAVSDTPSCCHNILPHFRPKGMDPAYLGLKSLKPSAQISHSFL
jgi:hypothetical protein